MQWWYELIGLLPFDWAQPDHFLFLKSALLAILLITPLFGLMSTMIVQNQMSFFSDALGHSGFAGIAIGSLCGLVQPMWAAVLFSVLFALVFSIVRAKSHLSSDTAIGVFSSTAVALGIFLATLQGRSFSKFNRYLIGDILSVTEEELAALALTLGLIVILWLVCYNGMAAAATHRTLAGSRGVPVLLYEIIFAMAVAVVVTIAMTWVGLLVINSLLVLPAASARNVAKNLRQYHWYSIASAVLAGLIGLGLSCCWGVSSGAAISLCLAAWFAVSFLCRKWVKQ